MLKKIIESKNSIAQFSKYIGIGGVSAICELSLFTIFEMLGASVFISKFISMILITCWNFILYKKIVFNK